MEGSLQHIGFICDGNATWAKKNHLSEADGYEAGFNAIVNTIKNLSSYSVKYATFYVFSTENWERPTQWLNSFFELANNIISNVLFESIKDINVKIKFIGDIERFSRETQSIMSEIEEKTKHKDGITAYIAASYGGRDEIVRAVNRAIAKGEVITEESISNNLDTYLSPNVDLMVRTKNKFRLSNFMLWQASYSEFVFIEELWPEFQKEQLDMVISEFNKRTRTFGKK